MSEFLHGIQIKENDSGPRPISGSNSAIIGLVGTSTSTLLQENEAVLIAGSRKDIKKYGLEIGEPIASDDSPDTDDSGLTPEPKTADFESNSLAYALVGILDQTGAMIVVVRAKSKSDKDIKSAIEALKSAESVVHQCPRILIAPGFSRNNTVRTALGEVAQAVRGVAVVDCADEKEHTKAVADIKGIDDARIYAVYPPVKVAFGEAGEREEPASARVAGVIARSDSERGFWYSPSNQPITGVIGTKYPIDFALDNPLSTANQLNEGKVATIIQQNGYRLWGNRSSASDAKWRFISVRRTADLINDALLRSHLWAVDRNITKTYVEDVTEGVNAYLRHLKNRGAIINGKCWAEIDENTPDQIQQGRVTFSFDFTPPYPAEHIIFNSRLVNDYLVEIFA